MSGPGTVGISVQTGRFQIILWLLTGSLISLNFLVSVIGGLGLLPGTLTRFFDGNDQDSFLSGTKSTLLLLATVLMAGCAIAARRRDDPAARGWQLLGLVSGFGFADELTHVHASVAGALRERYHFQGLERYTWAVVYLPAAMVVLLVLVRDARHLPPQVRNRLVPGGALYALGVIGLEPLTAILAEGHGGTSLSFKIMAAVADGTALMGLTFVACAVLIAASQLAGAYTIVLTTSEPVHRSAAPADQVSPAAQGSGWPAAPLPEPGASAADERQQAHGFGAGPP